MNKLIILTFLLLSTINCVANMSSPFNAGTMSAIAILSRDIDIQNERIVLTIDEAFQNAHFHVEYNIKSDREGNQVPLLFLALNYSSKFSVIVDGIRVDVKKMPDIYNKNESPNLNKFPNSGQNLDIDWGDGRNNSYETRNLQYFEVDLKKGEHQIIVDYEATSAVYYGNWIKVCTIPYSLTPAKYWRSFGQLEIVLNMGKKNRLLATNLGQPNETTGSITKWTFNKLPGDFFKIQYTPSISILARLMLTIGPLGFAIFGALCYITVHILWIKKYRKAHPTAKYSLATIAGSFILPLAVILTFLFSYPFIDWFIGPAASQRHGYVFLVIVLYPIVLPFYWIGAAIIDDWIKQSLKKHQKT